MCEHGGGHIPVPQGFGEEKSPFARLLTVDQVIYSYRTRSFFYILRHLMSTDYDSSLPELAVNVESRSGYSEHAAGAVRQSVHSTFQPMNEQSSCTLN